MTTEAAVKQSAANAEYNAKNICDPIVDVGTAIEVRLD